MDDGGEETVVVVASSAYVPILPLELIGRIFSYLDVADLARCCVSNEILKNVWVERAWSRLYLRDFTIARRYGDDDEVPKIADHAVRLELEDHQLSVRDK